MKNGNEDVVGKWDLTCEESFEKLKKALTEAPVLGFPDFTRILETDASLLGLGAVLSQQQETGLVVLGYASRALRPSERDMNNYSSMKLELLALHWAITQKYRDLLIGAEFIVYTDNNPLSYLFQTQQKPRSVPTALVATSTIPSLLREDMATLQSKVEVISRVQYFWKLGHPPTLRLLMKESKLARRLLRGWKHLF